MFSKGQKRAKTNGLAVLAITLILVCTTVFGSDHSNDVADFDLQGLLDDIVVSASKHQETLEEAPANVFIVSREMIENYGFQSVGEALSIVPGIYITDDYTYSQVGVRGIAFFGDWNSRVMVLVDGRPTNEQYGGTSSIDVTGIDIDNIDRIEVIKGPSSTLYGSNAFLGIINLITYAPSSNSVTAGSSYDNKLDEKSGYYSLFHRFENGLSIHSTASFRDRGGSNLFFSEFSDLSDPDLLSLDADGYYQAYLDSASFTNGISQKKNTLRNFSTHNKIGWKDFSLTLHYSQQDNGIPGAPWGVLFNRSENEFRERHHYIDLGYDGQINEDLNLSARFSYDHYFWGDYMLYNYNSLEVSPDYEPGPYWLDFEHDNFFSSEVKLFAKLGENNSLIAGGEVQFHNIAQESGEADATGEIITANLLSPDVQKTKGQIYNVFVQDEHRFSDKLKAVGGMHFNYFTYTTGRVVPKGAIIYSPYKGATYKFIASQGFRSPTFYEMTFDDSYYYLQNRDLKPELITSYEFITTHKFAYGISAEVSANHSIFTDLILSTIIEDTDPAHPGGTYLSEITQFQNSGKIKSTSLDFSLRRNPLYRLSGFLNVTYQKLKLADYSEGSHAFNSPKWLGNIGVTYQFVKNSFSGTLWANYKSDFYLWDETKEDGHLVFNANLNFNNVLGHIDITTGLHNVLNTKYNIPLGWDYDPSTTIQAPRRSIFVKLKTNIGFE